MNTFSIRPIRLLLQLLTARDFIGERDKVASGRVSHVKPQGTCGRLLIVTDTDESCVWRLSPSVVDAIHRLWYSLDTDLREDEILYDSEMDRIANGIVSAKSDHERRLIWSIVCPMAQFAY